MFAPYTRLDQCIGKEVNVRVGGENYLGLLVGVYALGGQTMLVVMSMEAGAGEQHIPLQTAVVTVKTQ